MGKKGGRERGGREREGRETGGRGEGGREGGREGEGEGEVEGGEDGGRKYTSMVVWKLQYASKRIQQFVKLVLRFLIRNSASLL